MTPMLSRLISRPSFSQIFERYPSNHAGFSSEAVDTMSKLVKAVQMESGLPINAKVGILPGLVNGEYDFDMNEIRLPYNREHTGIDLYIIWRHEAKHAEQNTILKNPEQTSEKTLLQLSRFLYPTEVEKPNSTEPVPEYSYNYGELQARAVEAKALREALLECRKGTPMSFRRDDKQAYLNAFKRFKENVNGIHSVTELLKYMRSQKDNILHQQEDSDRLPHQDRAKLLRFWNTVGVVKSISAFVEFQREYKALEKEFAALEQEIADVGEATLADLAAERAYQEQVTREVEEALKDSPARIAEVTDIALDAPAPLTNIRGNNAMFRFLKEYAEHLDKFTIVKPMDATQNATYNVYYTADLQHEPAKGEVVVPDEYTEDEPPAWIDEVEKVELDEIEDVR